MVAAAVEPVAKKLKDAQDLRDLQRYNDRFDIQKQAEGMAQHLQHRRDADLPAAPSLVPGGDPDIWRKSDPVIDRADVPNEFEPTQKQEERAATDTRLQGIGMAVEAEMHEARPDWDWDE